MNIHIYTYIYSICISIVICNKMFVEFDNQVKNFNGKAWNKKFQRVQKCFFSRGWKIRFKGLKLESEKTWEKYWGNKYGSFFWVNRLHSLLGKLVMLLWCAIRCLRYPLHIPRTGDRQAKHQNFNKTSIKITHATKWATSSSNKYTTHKHKQNINIIFPRRYTHLRLLNSRAGHATVF